MEELLTKLAAQGISLNVEGEGLAIYDPNKALSEELLAEIKEHKSILIKLLNEAGIDQFSNKSIPQAEEAESYPLSAAQRRLYFLHQFEPDSLAYNMPSIVELEGNLDIDRLHNAFVKLIKRHDLLRTYFSEENGTPVQKISVDAFFEIRSIDVNNTTTCQELVTEFIRPFDLSNEPGFEVGLIMINPFHHMLLVNMHHIITDGVSHNVLISEFMTLYNDDSLQDLRLQYKDYAVWQNDESNNDFGQQKDFWIKEYQERPEHLDLPYDFPRPAVVDNKGKNIKFEIDEADTSELKALADQEGTTLFMVVFAMFNVLISKLGNQNDLIIGVPTAGRHHSDVEDMIGMFVNTLPIRNDVNSSQTFKDLLLSITSKTLKCFDNEAYQYEDLIDELKIARNTSRNPLFDVLFTYENYENKTLNIPGLKVTPQAPELGVAQFDIDLGVIEADDKLCFNLAYFTSLFKEETIQRFVAYFQHIKRTILDEPTILISELEILPAKEKDQLLIDFNNTTVAYPKNDSFVDLFESMVDQYPDKIAVIHNNHQLTYFELNGYANRIAHYLESRGIIKGQLVPLLLNRSIDLLAWMIGIQKAGGAFVAIDVRNPKTRILKILNDCSPFLVPIDLQHLNLLTNEELISFRSVVLCDEQDVEEHFREFQSTNIDSKVIVDDLAYIVYTSGSTGQPKGVMIHHGGLINHLRGLSDKLELDQNDTFAQTAECSFDVYVLQFLLTLIKGGSTRIIDREQVLDIDSLAQIVNNEAITIMELVPSLIRPLLQSDIDLDRTSNQLRWLITTGEPISYELVQDWYNRYPTKPLVNAYGPAEVSDDVTLYIIPNACSDIQNKVPVGKPLANLKVYVLNTDLDLCPIGVTGELYISGIGVGQGYWNDKEKTAEKFIENPFVSALSSTNHDVLYKTGDIGYWTPDGNIVVVGRVDNMVKIRGARIEIGEIEEALGAHEEIMECAVVVKGEEGQEYLVGYYQSENEIANLDLKQHLSVRLPDYMIPPSYMHLEEMPRTLNGKLDRNALSDQDVTLDELYIPAFTNEQKLLVKIWSDVLGVKQLGITHNFFQVGGDSIKSIQISSRMRAEGYNLTVKDIFTYQTIEELSQHLVRLTNQCDQSTITGGIPLSPIQKRYFEDVKVARHHYNQSMMLHFKNGISVEMVSAIFEKIQLHHDALRVVFKETDGQFIQENNGIDMSVSVYEEDLSGQIEFDAKLLQCCNALQRSINIEEGPLVKLGLFHNSDGSRLLIVIHHLVVDGVSWRIILEDIATLYDQAQNYDPLTLPLKTDSFQKWSRQLSNYIDTDDFEKGKQYWNRLAQMNTPMIPMDNEEGESSVRNTKQRSFKLDAQYTDRLLKDIHKPFNTNVNDILVTALMLSINDQYGFNEIKVDLEGHGRNTLGESIDITRTVGWFTSIFPVLLSCDSDDLIKTIKSVKEAIHNVPNDGFDHLVNNYLNDNATKEKRSGIVFNYLGQFDNSLNNDEVKLSSHPRGMEIAPNQSVEYPLDISAAVYNGQLELAIDYCNTQFNDSTIQSLLDAFHQELIEVIAFCSDFKDMVLTPSDLTFRGLTIDELDHLQSSYKIEDVYPLTPLQEGLLFHSLLNDEGSQYFEQMNCKWTGNLDVKAAEQSFNSLISRYDVLRTIFLHKGYDQPLQLVLNDRHVPFKFRDVSAECLKGSRKAVVEKYCAVDRSNKFDLSQDVLMRLTILKTSDNEYEFIWSHHHILMDGWCVSIIFGDFMSFYQNQVNGLNIYLPKVQPYAKYLRWLEKFDKRGSEIYWQNLLSEFDVQTSFPKKSQTTNDQYELETQTVSLTGRKYQALKHFVSNNGITLNTIVKSAWGLLLSKYNDVKDVVFGAVVSGRPSAVDNVESIVGLFINTIPVRVRLNRDHDFLALAKQVQTETIESEPYHYHALTEIQNLSDIEAELFDHILVFENYPIDQNIANQADADHIISDVNIFEQDSYDLSITIMESNQLKIEFNYNSLVYDSETINSIATHFKNILEQAIELPSQEIGKIDMLADQESRQLLLDFNNTEVDYAEEDTFVDLFERMADEFSDNKAIIHNADSLTYAELNSYANRIAHYLDNEGIKKGQIVPLILPRGIDLLAWMIGVQKIGGVFVAIDTRNPEDRIVKILKDCQPFLAVAHQPFESESNRNFDDLCHSIILDRTKTYREQFSEFDSSNMTRRVYKDDLAYIIYTSGSTGQPKGVLLHQWGMINHFRGMADIIDLDSSDCFAQTAETSFDVCIIQFLFTLIAGGSTLIVDREVAMDPSKFMNLLQNSDVTIMELVPAVTKSLLWEKGLHNKENKLKWLISIAEQMPVELAQEWYDTYPHVSILNAYGPAEASDDVTGYVVPQDLSEIDTIPIGKPLPNLGMYILDEDLSLCPIGVKGEVCISGVGVGKGYLNDETKTGDRFIANPYVHLLNKDNHDVIYRTGDTGYWQEDGTIIFLGRNDNMVKIRGARVEPGEVEQAVLSNELIHEVVVTVGGKGADKYLMAYYVSDEALDTSYLRDYISDKLPAFMLPSHFMYMDEMPRTLNGKVNRKKLPIPDSLRNEEIDLPINETQVKMRELWSDVLDMDAERISINRSFFELGGHSLKAMKVVNKVLEVFELSIALADVFEYDTINTFAEHVDNTLWASQQNQESSNRDGVEEITL